MKEQKFLEIAGRKYPVRLGRPTDALGMTNDDDTIWIEIQVNERWWFIVGLGAKGVYLAQDLPADELGFLPLERDPHGSGDARVMGNVSWDEDDEEEDDE